MNHPRPLNLRVIDFETTDLPENGGRIIEIGYTDQTYHHDPVSVQWKQTTHVSQRFGIPPEVKIAPSAKAAHHIWEQELPSWDILDQLTLSSFLQCEQGTSRQFDYLIAHNCEFEEKMFALYNYGPAQAHDLPPFICTMKCAKRVWPRADQHTLSYLRYHAELEGASRDPRCDPPHAAGPDTWVTALLFHRMVTVHHLVPGEMRSYTLQPEFHAFCPLGKYKGKEWHQVDTGYLNWILRTPDMEEGIKSAARIELNSRTGDFHGSRRQY